MTDFLSGGTGTLRIGVVSSAANTPCIGWLKKFYKTHPGVRFELHEGNTFRMLEAVRAGEVELALVRRPFPAGELSCTVIRSDALCAAGLKKYIPKSGKISLKKLDQVPLILYRRWETTIRNAFEEAGVHPRIFCMADDARTVIAMAEEGMGVGIVPPSVISEKGKLHMLELKDPQIMSELCIVSRNDTYQSAAARQFKEAML